VGRRSGLVAQDEPAYIDGALTELAELHRAANGQARIVQSVAHTLSTPPELTGQNITALAADADANSGEDEPADQDPLAGFGWDRQTAIAGER